MVQKRVVIARRAVSPVPSSRKSLPGNSSTTTSRVQTRTCAAEHTTTTNVVSVVCEASHAQTSVRAREPKEQLLDSVLALNVKERKELLDRLLLEHQNEARDDQRDVAMWATAVHQQYTALYGSGDGVLVAPLVMKKLVQATASWEHVRRFMETSKLSELPVTERQGAYQLLAEILVRHAAQVARRSGAPLSPKLVSQCTVNLPGAFENQFPGYVAAGLAKVVARQPRLR